jgi:hypothetical protein
MNGRAAELRARLRDTPTEGLEPYLAQIDALVAEGRDPRELAAAAAMLAAGRKALRAPDEVDDAPHRVPFWIPTGRKFRTAPEDILGALCQGLGLPRAAIGGIDIGERNTDVWISADHAELVERAGRITVRGRLLRISRSDGVGERHRTHRKPRAHHPRDRHGPPRHRDRKGPPRKGPKGPRKKRP